MCGPGEGAGDFNPNVFLSGHTQAFHCEAYNGRSAGSFLRVMVNTLHFKEKRMFLCQVHSYMQVEVFCIDMHSTRVLILRYSLVSSAYREVKTSPIATFGRSSIKR